MRTDALICPSYRSVGVNEPIDLGEGSVEIEADGAVEFGIGRAVLRLSPASDLIIKTSISNSSSVPWPVGDLVSFRYAGSKKSRAQVAGLSFRGGDRSVDIDVHLRPNPQRLLFQASKQTRLASMIFHIANFPAFLCGGDNSTDIQCESKNGKSTSYKRLGCSILEDGVWRIEIQELPETSKLIEKMKNDGGSAITHVGRLVRRDNRLFSASKGSEPLRKLYLFLSFVRGGWTSPLLCVGRNRLEETIFEDWSQRTTSPWHVRTSWFDVHHGEWMAKLYPGFTSLIDDDMMGKAVSSALYWYLRSNSGGTGFGVDSGIILSSSGLGTAFVGVS